MKKLILALAASLLPCASFAQVVTVTAPLPDKSGDGRVIVSTQAKALGVSRGTVLTRCGQTLVYVGPKSVCPPQPEALSVAATPAAPRLTSPGTFATTRNFSAGGGSIANMRFTGLGTISRPRGVVPDLTLRDIQADGASFILRNFEGSDATPRVTIARVTSLNAGPGGFYFRGSSSGTITDVRIEATRPNTQSSKVPAGIGLAGKNANDNGGPWTISRFYIRGMQSTGDIFNGDGIATEKGYHDVTITDGYSGWNRDAGYDIKSVRTTLNRVAAEGNRRNFKVWGDSDWGTITSIDPCQPGRGECAHVQVQGSTRLHIGRLIARSGNATPLFQTEGGIPTITVDACDLKLPVGTPLLKGKAVLHLGPGCTAP
ncbi:hypothetical protein SAMN05192583_2927 [Sphingomonas gellani]|uniref:Right handed beta helix region n=1 Tax=Sphingomonas gellani TaxID=1166340 RepID=A0A1H8H4Q8_9SPHN|nr:hypothetical protein [Sphingomonas gellani]SEN50999.1 hypothetical protein SAMN05192583_2927 [Sphingomonas gellani]